jgi:hypothetical protein
MMVKSSPKPVVKAFIMFAKLLRDSQWEPISSHRVVSAFSCKEEDKEKNGRQEEAERPGKLAKKQGTQS